MRKNGGIDDRNWKKMGWNLQNRIWNTNKATKGLGAGEFLS